MNKKGSGMLTKAYFGASLMVLVGLLVSLLLVDLGNNYGVTIGDKYSSDLAQYSQQAQDLQSIQEESADISETADINQETQDTAQFQGAISAQNQNINVFIVAKDYLNDLSNVISFNMVILGILLSILSVSLIAGIYYMLRGITP